MSECTPSFKNTLSASCVQVPYITVIKNKDSTYLNNF